MANLTIFRTITAVFFMVTLPFWPASAAFGQIVDIQEEVNKKAEAGVSGALSSSWDRRQGDVDLTAASASALVRYLWQQTTFLALANHEQGQQDQEEHLYSTFRHMRVRYESLVGWGWEAFGQVDHNRYRGTYERRLWGTGPMMRWLDDPSLSLLTGLSLMRETQYRSEQASANQTDREKSVNRLSLSVSFSSKLAKAGASHLSVYYQPNLTDRNDNKLAGNGSLRFGITETLSFSVSLSITRDSRPPLGDKETNVRAKNGLTLVF